jgi:MFS family permease
MLLASALFLIYNANGREIGSYDSQPTKFAARELVLRGTLTLDEVVARVPGYAERAAFVRTQDGHYRSAYSVVPSMLAAGVAWPLSSSGLVDLDAPLAPNLVAVLTASLCTTAAVVLAFFAARRRCSDRAALLVAVGLGLGTNYWALVSQTLWQHETAVLGLAGAVLMLARPESELTAGRLLAAGLFLALAGAARPQLTPAVGVILLATIVRVRAWRAAGAVLPAAAAAATVLAVNLHWFGHPLGAMPQLLGLHPEIHQVESPLSGNPLAGAAGLLFSPSRGLIVFSPIALVALAGLPAARRENWSGDLRWWLLGAGVQLAVYSSYAVWWAGHTYGPRYALDVLPLLVPLAAAGVHALRASAAAGTAGAIALAWSILMAGTGAFAYPAERWNTHPASVDRHHERLWDWRDPQFVRCWTTGPTPQNFRLFSRYAVRQEGV